MRLIRPWWRLVLTILASGATMGWASPALAASVTASSPAPLAWSTVSPATSPPPLTGASAVYDGDTGTVVVFGGSLSNGSLSSTTWVWDGSNWTGYPDSGPPPRKDASMAFDPWLHRLILFGGVGAGGTILDDTWAWNGQSWLPVTGNSPPALEGAAMSVDANHDLVLFGGTGSSSELQANAPGSTSSTSTTSATTAGGSGSGGVGSGAGSGGGSGGAASGTGSGGGTASGTGSGGGTGSGAGSGGSGSGTGSGGADSAQTSTLTTSNETWVWNGKGWAQSTASAPPARTDASMTFDPSNGETILFGGSASPAGSPTAALSDTWSWDGSSWKVERPSTSPPARAGAAFAYDAVTGSSILFGGTGASGVLGDTWSWNGSSWKEERPSGSPPARSDAASAYDATSGQLVLFGGTGADGKPLGDTVILSQHPPVTISPAPSTSTSTTSTSASSTTSSSTSQSSTPAVRLGHHRLSAPTTTTSRKQPPLIATTHTVRQGQLVTLVGSGFKPGATVVITFHSTPYVVGKATANSAGRFSATVAVPDHAAPGLHHFVAAGPGPSGATRTLVTPVRVVAFTPPGTGDSSLEKVVLVAIAFAIPVATWFTLDLLGRLRRRPARQGG